MLRVTSAAIHVMIAMGVLAVATLPAAAQPPLGENLVADPSFEADLVATPWQATGPQAQMLCPDEHCGNCFRRSGDGVLIFEARDTDDVWSIQQTIALPPADTYDLSFYLAGCNGAPGGIVSVALGQAMRTITLDGVDDIDTYQFHAFSFDAAEVFGAEGESTIAGGFVALTFGNPALSNANVSIDDVRLVARDGGSACGLAPQLQGEWQRVNHPLSIHDHWTFNPDGSFVLITGYFEYGATYYSGSYCTDTTTNPARITMLADSRCDSTDAGDLPGPDDACGFQAGDYCDYYCGAPISKEWHGIYKQEQGILSLRVSTCPPSTFGDAPKYLPGHEYNEFTDETKSIAPCAPAEGEVPEGNEEGEPSVEVDADLLGYWEWRNCRESDSDIWYESWEFHTNGTFEQHAVQGDNVYLFTVTGRYLVNTSVYPRRVLIDDHEACVTITFDGTYCQSRASYLAEYGFQDGQLLMSSAADGSDLARYDHIGGYCEGEAPEEGEAEMGGREAEPDAAAAGVINSFVASDADHNGSITEGEAASLELSRIEVALFDLNNDGMLSGSELLHSAGTDALRHSMDTNLDGAIAMAEMLRLIQLYNAGGYSCAPLAESEDGYLPESSAEALDPDCPAHASDYNPADANISLSELLRGVQLYSLGAYALCETASEDSFCDA